MTDESTAPSEQFGEIHTIGRDRFGLVSGGTLGGGFGWLLDYAKDGKWERGIFGQADREFLLETPPSELTTASARSTRQRIRKRVLSTYFDARLLRYIDDRDRELIFQNARDAGYELHFREGFKEFIRFTYLGLRELETDIDIQEIIETAVREAEEEYALERGQNVSFDAEIDVTRVEGPSVEELERRYSKREKLDRRELAVLVKSEHRNDREDVEDAASIGLTDALYYDARQPGSDPHGRSWEDPDREEAERIVEWLSSVFDEHDIEDYDDLEVGIARMNVIDEELTEDLRSKLSRLPRAAPEFNEQLDWGSGLPESDNELLYQIQHNPDNIDVETTLQEYARPPTAGPDWNPAEDEYLQKFIARVQVAREKNSFFTSGSEEGRERWNRVVELAEFDREEWGEYMQERRVERCKDAIERLLENTDEVSRDDLADLLNDDVPDADLADYDTLQEDQDLSQDEVENMRQFEALWTLLPDDADTEELRDVANWFGEGPVLEAIREVATVGGDASE